jgi:hypothetical protein
VRCCRVGYDMDLDFLTCNNDSDSDKKVYISVCKKNKMKKVIVIIDK